MSSVAEYPDRIKRLFLQRNRSPVGAYCIALCINGEFVEVVVDDLVPVYKDKTTPTLSFCHNDEEEIWGILMEKAYAKAYGGYFNMGCGGPIPDAL